MGILRKYSAEIEAQISYCEREASRLFSLADDIRISHKEAVNYINRANNFARRARQIKEQSWSNLMTMTERKTAMITTEQALTLGVIGIGILAGILLSQEINAKTKEIVGLTDKVTALTKQLEVEKAKQPDAIQLATPQITTETKEEYIKRNTAPIDRIEFADMSELKVGDMVIYTSGDRGRVLRIKPKEGSWEVETTHGKGEYMRWGTETHDGDGIRGIVR